jgi:hypothetical protein
MPDGAYIGDPRQGRALTLRKQLHRELKAVFMARNGGFKAGGIPVVPLFDASTRLADPLHKPSGESPRLGHSKDLVLYRRAAAIQN